VTEGEEEGTGSLKDGSPFGKLVPDLLDDLPRGRDVWGIAAVYGKNELAPLRRIAGLGDGG
jgi:hypothetical protein